MKRHEAAGQIQQSKEHGHGNSVWPKTTKPCPVEKVKADTVPYGEQITRRGGYVYVIREQGNVVAVGATADEARRKYTVYRANTPRDAAKVGAQNV